MATFTDIKIWKAGQNAPKGLLANGSVLVAGVVEVKFAVREGPKGLFAALPSQKGKDKEGNEKWYNQVSFPDKETYAQFQKAVVDAFKNPKAPEKTETPETADDSLPF